MKPALSQFFAFACSVLLPLAVQAAPVAQAAADEIDSQGLDPNGFKLMIVCISILVLFALCLIGGVVFYFMKSKKTKG